MGWGVGWGKPATGGPVRQDSAFIFSVAELGVMPLPAPSLTVFFLPRLLVSISGCNMSPLSFTGGLVLALSALSSFALAVWGCFKSGCDFSRWDARARGSSWSPAQSQSQACCQFQACFGAAPNLEGLVAAPVAQIGFINRVVTCPFLWLLERLIWLLSVESRSPRNWRARACTHTLTHLQG